MEQKEIVEGNVLIAYFMGGTKQDVYVGKYKQVPQFWNDEGHHLAGCKYSDKTLEYHFNWSWLMPVVEKITRQLPKGVKENNYIQSSVKIEASMNSGYPYNLVTHCQIGDFYVDNKSTFCISKATGADGKDGSLIHSVWAAIVQYIKWYNENNNDRTKHE
jgi:hypothetical protein